MRISKLENVQTGYNKGKSDVSFKCTLGYDIGASTKKQGTLKLLVQTNDGKDLFTYNGFVNDDPKGFESEFDFCKKVAKKADIETLLNNDINSLSNQFKAGTVSQEEEQKLAGKIDELKNNLKTWQELPAEEKKISKISLLLPGTIQKKKALFMRNLLKKDDKYLKNVNLKEVIAEIKKQGNARLADNFSIKNDFQANKDLKGTGAAIVEKFMEHEKYGKVIEDLIKRKDAVRVSAAMTGGGLGLVDIIGEKDNGKIVFRIETNESGHDIYPTFDSVKPKRLGEMGTSASTVVKRFAGALGVIDDADLKILGDTGIAKLVTQKQVKIAKTVGEEPLNILLGTGVYDLISQNSEATTIRVKPERIGMFDRASKKAINKYAQSLALNAITAINKNAKYYVATGPLAMGLDARIREQAVENPVVYGKDVKDMRTLILKSINDLVNPKEGKPDTTIMGLIKDNKFDVICEEAMSIPDNTKGGILMLHGDHRGSSNVVIAMDIIKKLSKKVIKTV